MCSVPSITEVSAPQGETKKPISVKDVSVPASWKLQSRGLFRTLTTQWGITTGALQYKCQIKQTTIRSRVYIFNEIHLRIYEMQNVKV